jgi:hypothetical protein
VALATASALGMCNPERSTGFPRISNTYRNPSIASEGRIREDGLSQKLSEIRGFRKRSFSNEGWGAHAFPDGSGFQKTAPRGNWRLECSELAVRSSHRTAKRTILNKSSGDPYERSQAQQAARR